MNIGTACCHSPTCSDRECPGRPDPEATRRQQEAELRWSCRDQMSARQLYEHERAGDFVGDRHAGIVGHALHLTEKDVGVECALPIIVDDIKPAPRFPALGKRKPLPTDWRAVTRWGAAVALCLLWTAVVIWR